MVKLIAWVVEDRGFKTRLIPIYVSTFICAMTLEIYHELYFAKQFNTYLKSTIKDSSRADTTRLSVSELSPIYRLVMMTDIHI